jgi:glycosyltransferase involved in cell wall biosynthesis
MGKVDQIDFLFVIARPQINDGGYVIKHALYLAEEVRKKGYSVAFLILPQADMEIALIRKKKRTMPLRLFLANLLYDSLFFFKFSNYLFQIFNLKFNRYAYNLDIPDEIKIFYSSTRCISLSKRVVCNDWFSAHYLSKQTKVQNGYFIVYHSHENEYVGLSDIVITTYDRWPNIIVTNEVMRRKLNLSKEAVMTVAIDNGKILKENDKEKKANTVLISIRKGPIKGAEYAIEAINTLLREREDITVYTFGDLNLEQLSNPKWINLGYVTNDDLKNLFSISEIFVSPSIEDGVPGTAAEAMANGCAVVCTDVSGARELIDDGHNGLIVPIRDPVSIVKNVNFLLTHRDVMKKLQNNARDSLKKFSRENMAESFLSVVHYYEQSGVPKK